MRASIFPLAAAGVLAAGALALAVPASALTVQPLSATSAAPAAKALFSDPVMSFNGSGYRAAIVGDDPGASGLPVYFEPTQAGAEADETRYAADPVRFMAQVNNVSVADADAPSTRAVQAAPSLGASKAAPAGR